MDPIHCPALQHQTLTDLLLCKPLFDKDMGTAVHSIAVILCAPSNIQMQAEDNKIYNK